MSKVIEDFIELIEYELECDKKELANAKPVAKSFHSGIVEAMEFIVECEEYQALKDSIAPQEDKPTTANCIYGNEDCPKCGKSNNVEQKKQTLAEFAIKEYPDLMRDDMGINAVMTMVSQYLEQKD